MTMEEHAAMPPVRTHGDREAALEILPTTEADGPWARALLEREWGGPTVAVHDTLYTPGDLPGFKALIGGESVGLVTYRAGVGGCEIVTINSLREGRGIGSALVEAVKTRARESGCARLWLVTTNDNLGALWFYAKRGFRLVRVDLGAVDRARRLKPGIPPVGEHGLPMRDELELEMLLTGEEHSP
jgi:GNAT superfamily N-acetyltransferase